MAVYPRILYYYVDWKLLEIDDAILAAVVKRNSVSLTYTLAHMANGLDNYTKSDTFFLNIQI